MSILGREAWLEVINYEHSGPRAGVGSREAASKDVKNEHSGSRGQAGGCKL